MRDALYGLSRFDEFEKSLGIAPNILARRLAALVAAGMLERQPYSEHPPRFEYRLTAQGRDFRPVILSLLAWGNRNFAPEGVSVAVVDTSTGTTAIPVLVDQASGRDLSEPDFRIEAGPAADSRMRRRASATPVQGR